MSSLSPIISLIYHISLYPSSYIDIVSCIKNYFLLTFPSNGISSFNLFSWYLISANRNHLVFGLELPLHAPRMCEEMYVLHPAYVVKPDMHGKQRVQNLLFTLELHCIRGCAS